MILELRETTKNHLNILALVLVTGAITLGTSALIDDAFASGDKYKKKNQDREYDSYDDKKSYGKDSYESTDYAMDSYDDKKSYGQE